MRPYVTVERLFLNGKPLIRSRRVGIWWYYTDPATERGVFIPERAAQRGKGPYSVGRVTARPLPWSDEHEVELDPDTVIAYKNRVARSTP